MQLRYILVSTIIAAVMPSSLGWSQSQRHSIIAKHVPNLVNSGRAAVVGPVDPTTSMRLYLSLPLKNEPVLDELLVKLQNPHDPLYHKYLRPEEFTNRFGPGIDDYAAVVAWARGNGFEIGAAPPNRRFVDITGTVAAINNAFAISLTTYLDQTHNRQFFAPDQEPTASLTVQLLAVSGLDNANPPESNLVTGNEVGQPVTKMGLQGPNSSNNGSGQGGTFVPSDMRVAYYGTGPLNGAGQTVAIFSYAPYSPSDLQLYYQYLHMSPTVPVNVVAVNGFNSNCGSPCSDGEQVIDIANVIGMAPGLSQILFYEGTSSTSVLNQMATDDKASVITNSWYNGDFGTASDPIFKQFQALGQTFLSASGDFGDYNNTGLGGGYGAPELDPYITQIGGTTLNVLSAGGTWNSEIAWSLGSSACAANGSGGGWLSNSYSIPTFQQSSGVITSSNLGSSTWRNSPDVSAEAACDNSEVSAGTFYTGEGGTSYAAPRWAGFIALANQQAAINGVGAVGFLAPRAYSIGISSSYLSNFHDIISGNNGVNGSNGFPAVAGYDLVTGWGSPNGQGLINDLISPSEPTAAAPQFSNISVTSPSGGPSGSNFVYTIDLGDSTPAATIYYTVHACGGSYTKTGSMSPGQLVVKCTGFQSGATASAYATAPGYITSPTNYASF